MNTQNETDYSKLFIIFSELVSWKLAGDKLYI